MPKEFGSPQALIRAIEDTFISQDQGLHPVIAGIASGQASREQLKGFGEQMWCIAKYNIAVVGGKASQLQPRPDDPFGLGKPYDLDIQKHFLKIVIEEGGSEVFGDLAPTLSHYELYLRFGEGCGIPREDLESVNFLPKIQVVTESRIDMARNQPLVESAIGMNWINETQFGQMGMALENGLRDHYGFTEDQLEFWAEHGVADVQHSSIGPLLIERYGTNEELRQRIWIAAVKGYGIMTTILDSIEEAYFTKAAA